MKTQNFTKLDDNMCQMTLNNYTKFHRDRIIGGGKNSYKGLKNSRFIW